MSVSVPVFLENVIMDRFDLYVKRSMKHGRNGQVFELYEIK